MGIEYGVQLSYGFGAKGSSKRVVEFLADAISEDEKRIMLDRSDVTDLEDVFAEYLVDLPGLAGYEGLTLVTGGDSWGGDGYWFFALENSDLWLSVRDSEAQLHYLAPPETSLSELERLREDLNLPIEAFPIGWQLYVEAG